MRKIFLVAFVLLPVAMTAQKSARNNPCKVSYEGAKIDLARNVAQVQFVGNLQGVKGEGYQGMDIQGDTIVSCQNSGWISFYTYNGKKMTQIVPPYKMACYSKENHSNVVSLSNSRYDQKDKLPLLYVSQAAKQSYKGMKDVLFVERIANDLKSTKTVQTIYYRDENRNFGYALQWVVDRDNNMLYGYGNTISNSDSKNKHRIVKFRLPSVKDGKNGLVVLTDADLLENYLIEDSYQIPFNPIGQGLFVKNGLLFMPTGFGKEKAPSYLYVWDLKSRRMQNVIDLRAATFGELGDCALWRNSLMIHAQGHMFRMDF